MTRATTLLRAAKRLQLAGAVWTVAIMLFSSGFPSEPAWFLFMVYGLLPYILFNSQIDYLNRSPLSVAVATGLLLSSLIITGLSVVVACALFVHSDAQNGIILTLVIPSVQMICCLVLGIICQIINRFVRPQASTAPVATANRHPR